MVVCPQLTRLTVAWSAMIDLITVWSAVHIDDWFSDAIMLWIILVSAQPLDPVPVQGMYALWYCATGVV